MAGGVNWFHNCTILDKIKDQRERLWYAEAAIENGWSRNVLVLQMEAGLYKRQGKALTNFQRILPPPQSDLAQQLLKDPYNFDFLTLAEDAHEREIEAVDDTLKHPNDQPSIGLILCKSKTQVVVEYALRGTTTPMGIS